MKQNLMIVSYDYDVSKRLATKLADVFSMRVLDSVELFEFDHIPFSFADILENNGVDYVMKEMKSIIKMSLDFDDVIFVANINMANNTLDLFEKIKLSNFVILLKKDSKAEIAELSRKNYNKNSERDFYVLNEVDLKLFENSIETNLADVVIDIDVFDDAEIINQIIEQIKKYYYVN